MNRLFSTIIVFLLTTTMFAQGIEFFHGSYKEACNKAQQENKAIFVDVYTSWCGPCKKMARDVFTDKAVGDYFNKHFVCLKLDAEKEKENGFFKHYKAQAYPTYFWVDSKSNLLSTETGMASPQAFIAMAEKALKSNMGEKAKELAKRWEGGEHTYDMVQKYVLGILPKTNPEKVHPAVIEYLKGLSPEELKGKEAYTIVMGFMRGRNNDPFPDNFIFNTFMSNIETYSGFTATNVISTGTFWKKMYLTFARRPSNIYRNANKNVEGNSMDDYKAALKKLKGMDFAYKNMFMECLDAELILQTGDFKKAIAKMEKIFNTYGKEYPFLYSDLLYSLTYAGYFTNGKSVSGEKVLEFSNFFLSTIACKESLMYYAAALHNVGQTNKAMSALAWMEFYPKPMLSNAYYKSFGFENIRAQFPYDKPKSKPISRSSR